ncbi:MAG: hypothetical protein WBB48_11850 [Thermodesulfobacteriota bacterium]
MTNYTKNLLWLFFIPFIVVALSCQQDDGAQKEAEPTRAESNIQKIDPEVALQQRIEETKHLQEQRKVFIDGMLEGGLATRIENPNGYPYIYVTQPFYMLTQSEQASMMNAIWYYFITDDRGVDVLTIYDNDTGNQVGTFGRKGLLMAE